MKLNCPACKAEMAIGKTELILKRDRNVVVIEDVPAMVCPQCGEASIDAKNSQAAYSLAESEIQRGVALEFCKFRAA
jgi:YgiT-type zinc finger domain-containing protein